MAASVCLVGGQACNRGLLQAMSWSTRALIMIITILSSLLKVVKVAVLVEASNTADLMGTSQQQQAVYL